MNHHSDRQDFTYEAESSKPSNRSANRSLVDRLLIFPKTSYFFYYAAAACLIPYLPLYYQSRGLASGLIGILMAIGPLVILVSGPLWGGLADATRKHKLLLLTAILGTAAAVIGLAQANAFSWLIPLVILYAFFISPVSPLIDHSVLQLLGERKHLYGSQRMWGAVGWGIAAPLMGWVVQHSGLMGIFWAYSVLLLLCLLAVWHLPVSQAHSSAGFWQNLSEMRANQKWIPFLAAVLLAGAAQSLITNFLFLYLKRLGAGASLMGLSQTISTVSEIPFWLFSGWMLARWKPRGLLAVSLLLFSLRLIAYGLVQAPWLVLVIQLLHGPTFSMLVVAGVSYASEIALPGMGATAQTIFSSVMFGLGAFTGSLIGGILFDRTQGGAMFLWSGIFLLILLVPLILFIIWGRKDEG